MINALRGMKDLEGQNAFYYEKIIKVCEEIAKNYGFNLILTPHLELSKLFKRSVGESSDIAQKEMYEAEKNRYIRMKKKNDSNEETNELNKNIVKDCSNYEKSEEEKLLDEIEY